MPFGVLCYCMMWSTLSDATPASLKFLWYLLMYSFFQTCMTVRNMVPGAVLHLILSCKGWGHGQLESPSPSRSSKGSGAESGEQ